MPGCRGCLGGRRGSRERSFKDLPTGGTLSMETAVENPYGTPRGWGTVAELGKKDPHASHLNEKEGWVFLVRLFYINPVYSSVNGNMWAHLSSYAQEVQWVLVPKLRFRKNLCPCPRRESIHRCSLRLSRIALRKFPIVYLVRWNWSKSTGQGAYH